MAEYPHPPGHPQSVADGCACPVLDNAHGKGCGYLGPDGERLFVVNGDCRLHGMEKCIPPETVCHRDLSEPPYGSASRLNEPIA